MMYVRFPLSLRNVEDFLHERGIDISHETFRFWWNRFGPMFAAEIRRRRVDLMRSGTHRHLDEVFGKINSETHYFCRAVDHEREVLESFVTKRRDCKAALKFLRKTMKRPWSPTYLRHRQATFLWRGNEGHGQCRKTGNRTLAQQSS
jgi:putative transposase